MTPTVIRPTNPELPSDVTRPCMLPITSIGTNTTLPANRTCSMIDSPTKDRAMVVRPPIQDFIVVTIFSPAIWYIPPLVGLCYPFIHFILCNVFKVRSITPLLDYSVNAISFCCSINFVILYVRELIEY